MDQELHERQKAISATFIKIADQIAGRLGLRTRLHKLDIEKLATPECEIGVYANTFHLVDLMGTIEVRLDVASGKAKVVSALFRDVEKAVDDWTFDVPFDEATQTGELESNLPKDTRINLRCPNPDCSTLAWDIGGCSPLGPDCKGCGIPGEPYDKLHMMKCVNEDCRRVLWIGGDREMERCPDCSQLGETEHFEKTVDDSPRQECQMRCTNPACYPPGEWKGRDTELCPACKQPGERVVKP